MVEVELVYEPPPAMVVQKREAKRNWANILSPVKTAPGTMPRVARCDTRPQADYLVRSIRASLEKADQMDNWHLESHQIHDTQGGFGIWVRYDGKMTPAEYQRKLIARAERKRIMKKAYALRALRKQMQEDASLIRPFPGA
jgi:hypothetical protein